MLGDRDCFPNQTFQKCNRHSDRSSAGFSMMLCLARLPCRRPKDYEYHRCFLATRMRHGAGSMFGRRSRTMALAHVLLRLDLGNSRNGQIAHADRRVRQRSNPSPGQERPQSRAGASIFFMPGSPNMLGLGRGSDQLRPPFQLCKMQGEVRSIAVAVPSAVRDSVFARRSLP